MILDKNNLFSEDQAVTVTAVSTNVIDLGNDDALVQALNEKGEMFGKLFAQVTEDFAGGTSLSVTLKSSDSSTFSSSTTLLITDTVLLADLVAGYQFAVKGLPLISEQYLQLTYTVDGTMSAGTIMAGLVLDVQTNK